ncbi:MAG: tRNA pseudouridine(38-40) synthase TruA [Defluviitaleaceae bacterium]|nr:tRNA pseudouridine(38-40) synthase TruA [Defluviitaleaceae bacterium]
MGILLTIAYDGTGYCGWQVQKNGITICEMLEGAVSKLLEGQPFALLGASRTDSGVHALGQVAHIREMGVKTKIPPHKMPQILNSHLPDDIVVKDAALVPDDFHPIKDAKSKTYVYKIHNSKIPNPLTSRYTTLVGKKLNVDAMKDACKYFIGEHDFKTFSVPNSNPLIKTTVREVYNLQITQNNDHIEVWISGNGFLHNMVRIIAGTLVAVGHGQIEPNQIPQIIASKERDAAGKTMPPQGLTLVEVFYS